MADPGVLIPEWLDITPESPADLPQDGAADSSANQEDEPKHTDPLV